MYVIKRNGNLEEVNFQKISNRISYLVKEPYLLKNVNPQELAQKVIQGLYDKIHTELIDMHTADIAASMSVQHLDYLTLAGRIAINNHHKVTLNSFKDKMNIMYSRKDNNGKICPIVDSTFFKFVEKNQKKIDKYIDYSRDYNFSYFGFITLKKSYLISINDEIVERPQDMFMRVAIQLHIPENVSSFKDESYLSKVFHTYDRLSQQYYTHATPTLFNSGLVNHNLSSCFLLSCDDSIDGIHKTLWDCNKISKFSGGIGVHMSMIRGEGSLIRGTNGKSKGLIPQLRMFNAGARAYDQGGDKRKGSFAIYLEVHHPDIVKFLKISMPQGSENERCHDLFTALWISDLFMERVKSNGDWAVFCPDECPGLNDVFGDEYTKLYLKYEQEGRYKNKYKAYDIWRMIYESQKESGMPYMCYKDTVNATSMQNNIGVTKSSNLCAEITLYSDTNEYASCNLASICLPTFVKDTYKPEELNIPEEERRSLNHEFPKNPWIDYKLLAEVASEVCENLNNVIDKTMNPLIETARSNFRNRPIGIGVQGLADVFIKCRVAFDSDEARSINKKMAEAIYYGALTKSTHLSKSIYQKAIASLDHGSKEYRQTIYSKKVLETFPPLKKENVMNTYVAAAEIPKTVGSYPTYLQNGGSHLSNGKFHWEMYGLKPEDLSGMFDWESLREHIKIYGVRNSMTTAYMPTASTSQIMGFAPCFEPYHSNMYRRTTLAGDFTVINKFLIHDLHEYGLWDETIGSYLLLNNGSIQNIEGIPQELKELYKTVYEIKQRSIIDLASDRQPFIDQSQSMNLFFEEFNLGKFSSVHMYAWEKKLKTGSYYIRTREAVMPPKFTVSANLSLEDQQKLSQKMPQKIVESNEDEICLVCSS